MKTKEGGSMSKEREDFEVWLRSYIKSKPDSWDMEDYEKDSMFDAWQAAKAEAVPEGFVLMPRICTNKMAHAAKAIDGRLSAFKYADVYKAMIEAQEPAND